MKTRRVLLGAAAALGALMGIGPAAASAHPLLIQATPQPGVVAAASPAGIGLALTEPTVPRGSRIRLFGPGGKQLPVTTVKAADGRRTLTVKPRTPLRSAVYKVRWSALGDDGHIVTGSFDFGVAGPKGAAPPGVETLSGSGGGRGGESASGDGFARVLGRWLGILSASFLFGGFVLLALLRRRKVTVTPRPRADAEEDDPPAVDGIRAVAPLAWVLIAFAAVEGLFSGAGSGSGDKLDFGLLTASATGVSELVRAAVVVVLSGALALTLQRRRVRDALYLGGGVAILLTYALSGHVLSVPSFWALLDQGVHVLTAGLWLGGVLALLLLSIRGELRMLDGARTFAPVAGTALGVAIITGVLAAIREVDRWYFLRWSDYGRIVIIKAVLVALVTLAGAAAWWRSRGADAPGPRPRLLRAEAVGVVAVLAFAATLSGLAQGRGQPLPAQRGSLFAGPVFATALLPTANAPLSLAPARSGANVLSVGIAPGQPTPKGVSVRLADGAGAGGRQVRAQLQRHGGLTWSAPVTLPADGTWFAYVTVDGKTAPPVPLTVGLPHADGAPPVQVLAVADLSGPYAERCRAHLIGLQLALARINAAGGLNGGHKVAALVLDSGGTAAGAAAAARRGLREHPIASAGTCGTGGAAAIDAVSRAGRPSVVGDPAVDPTAAKDVYRLAADPFAQGVAFGQLVRNRIQAAAVPGVRSVRAEVGDDLQGRRLLAGLRVGLRSSSAVKGAPAAPGPEPRLILVRPGSLARLSDDALVKTLSQTSDMAFILDGPGAGGADAQAVARVGAARGQGFPPAPLLLSERVLSETLVQQAGTLGRIGAVQGVSEVATNTTDAELYQGAVPLLFRGNLASLDGLRGYAAGLALRDAVRSGTGVGDINGHLRSPRVFTNALLAPWSPARPGAGSPYVVALQPSFLSPTLVPSQVGGESQDTTYFPQGSWTVTSGVPLGISTGLRQPPVG